MTAFYLFPAIFVFSLFPQLLFQIKRRVFTVNKKQNLYQKATFLFSLNIAEFWLSP